MKFKENGTPERAFSLISFFFLVRSRMEYLFDFPVSSAVSSFSAC